MIKRINKTIIKKLNPCLDRFNNFVDRYPKFNGDLKEFLLLNDITYSDKVWVFTKLATHIENIKWSILCAESVLHLFETKYPQNNRPRLALQAAENFTLNPTDENKTNAANAAYAAAYATATAAYAAYATAAAANAANAAANAAYAAAYAANAAYAAAYAAYAAANAAAAYTAEKNQENLNLMFMIEAIK